MLTRSPRCPCNVPEFARFSLTTARLAASYCPGSVLIPASSIAALPVPVSKGFRGGVIAGAPRHPLPVWPTTPPTKQQRGARGPLPVVSYVVPL